MGPGLLGASLGMAIHARGLARTVSVWARREESRNACLETPWCQTVSGDLEEALRKADLAVLCTPVVHLSEMLGEIGDVLPGGCILTDVGSTKANICKAASEANLVSFVGSHPIAGSEKTGLENARADLFEKCPCFVTPIETNDLANCEKVTDFWQSLDMNVMRATPEEHDQILAHVSHLPHFLVSALCHALANQPAEWSKGSGQGLRDATRIAAGSPAIWRDIAQQNRSEILKALDHFDVESKNLRRMLEENDSENLFHWLNKSKAYRESIE